MTTYHRPQTADRRSLIDSDEIRRALPLVDLLGSDGVELKRHGPHLVACCPFHQESTPSFTVYHDDRGGHAHCFGCGFHARSIFDYWMESRHCDFKTAVADLGERIGGSARGHPGSIKKVTPLSQRHFQKQRKPALPKMRALNESEIAMLASVRGLPVCVIEHAARIGRIAFCIWPQRDVGFSVGAPARDSYPSWVILDESWNVAQFRRLDGGKYTLHDREIKAWTKGSPSWPVGASGNKDEIKNVLIVEGGPDVLAAYFFLLHEWRLKNGRRLLLPDIAVVGMLGASCPIADEALKLFDGKRVRIVIHNDAPQTITPKYGEPYKRVPSFEAAARWTEQLCAAGAAVETFSLNGIKRDGEDISDLNDLALCPADVWQSPDLRAAFFEWDF